MPRVKRSVPARRRRRRILKRARGYQGTRHRLLRTAREAVERAWRYAYRDRRQRKRQMRSLWITRINAAAREHGLSYSQLLHGLRSGGVEIDRKILADLALTDPETFAQLAARARPPHV